MPANILPKWDGFRAAASNTAPFVYHALAFGAGYLASGSLEAAFSDQVAFSPNITTTGSLATKIQAISGLNTSLAVGTGAAAIAGSMNKNFLYGLIGLGFAHLDNIKHLVSQSQSFADYGGGTLLDAMVIGTGYLAVGHGIRYFRESLKEKKKLEGKEELIIS